MTAHDQKINLASFKRLLGAPALLRSEDAKIYDEMLTKLAACVRTKDFLEFMLVKDFIDETITITRLRKAHAWSINCRIQIQNKTNERRERSEVAKEIASDSRSLLKEYFQSSTRHGLDYLGEFVLDAVDRDAGPEIVEAVALETTIDYQNKLTALIDAAYKRRSSIFQQLEWYRCTLGRELLDLSDAVISTASNGNDSSVASTSIIPSDE